MDLAHTLEELLVQLIGFLILFVVLKRVAWRPLLGVLDQRRSRIEEELRQMTERQAELARLQEDYGRRLAKIEEEARTKIQQAVLDGKRVASEIQEQARAQGQALVAKSKETIELELAKARVMLRDQVASMTLETVERVLQSKLDAQTDRKLVDAVLNELEGKAQRQ